VIVENRPGAGGVTASAYVAKSPCGWIHPVHGRMSTNSIQPNLVPNLPVRSAEDLAPVNLMRSVPHLIVVRRRSA
jgi:tripartite-type tricarboxylate transporter receptor subunit TctC